MQVAQSNLPYHLRYAVSDTTLYTHNPYACPSFVEPIHCIAPYHTTPPCTPRSSCITPAPEASVSPATQPSAWCGCCQERSTYAAEPFCSRRCQWTALGKCPQCGRKRCPGMVYCGMGCAREASHANWCPQCAVRQLASSSSRCTACGYVPSAVRAAAKGDAHGLLHPSEKEYKGLLKQWGAMNMPGKNILAVIRLAQSSSHRRAYLSYRAHVDVEVQSAGCVKYLHGGEGNELRRFYPSTYACEFGLHNGFNPCMDPACSVCSVAQHSPTDTHLFVGYSSVDRTLDASQPNYKGVKAVFLCRVVCGHAHHAPYPVELPDGHHSSVLTYSEASGGPSSSPLPSKGPSKYPQNGFFPQVVDDAIIVHRHDAVDPLFLILCA